MGYLIASDFKKLIQVDNLNQVINNDPTILESAVDDASAIVIERMVQKYLIRQELVDINDYAVGTVYKANQRVFLDFPVFNQALAYTVGQFVLETGSIWKCITNTTIATAFNAAQWTNLGPQFQIYYIAQPKPTFNVNSFYKIGDQVFYKDRVYTALKATQVIDHGTALQYGNYASLPLMNVFPDDTQSGLQYWGAGVAFSVIAGQLPTGWTKGDNRNKSLVRHCMAITLWIVHDRISPRNVPELREKRYGAAMKWLNDAADGILTADIPLIQPRSGGRIRFGGNIKNVNSY